MRECFTERSAWEPQKAAVSTGRVGATMWLASGLSYCSGKSLSLCQVFKKDYADRHLLSNWTVCLATQSSADNDRHSHCGFLSDLSASPVQCRPHMAQSPHMPLLRCVQSFSYRLGAKGQRMELSVLNNHKTNSMAE